MAVMRVAGEGRTVELSPAAELRYVYSVNAGVFVRRETYEIHQCKEGNP